MAKNKYLINDTTFSRVRHCSEYKGEHTFRPTSNVLSSDLSKRDVHIIKLQTHNEEVLLCNIGNGYHVISERRKIKESRSMERNHREDRTWRGPQRIRISTNWGRNLGKGKGTGEENHVIKSTEQCWTWHVPEARLWQMGTRAQSGSKGRSIQLQDDSK